VVPFKRGYCKVLSRHGSVAIIRWKSEDRAFAVEAYFSSGCSVIKTQLEFRNRFNLAPLAPVPEPQIENQLLHGDYIQANCKCNKTKN